MHSEETRILMDTGSQQTYIIQELAANLQLKSREIQEPQVSTFVNKKAKKITSPLLELKIKSQKDNTDKISIIPQINGLVQSIAVNIPEQQNLKKAHHLSHTLPQKVQTFGLLTGNDYYHELWVREFKFKVVCI